MAINLTLYNNKSEPNRIGKELEVVETFQGSLKDETSIINPVIEVKTNIVPLSNYAYIPDFGRYYFITDIISIRNGLWAITMKSDPLESFKSEIKACNAVIARQEFLYNLYLEDNKLNILTDRFTIDKKFPTGIFSDNNGSNILMISGFVKGYKEA